MARGNFVEKYEVANKWLRLQNKNISIVNRLRDKGITQIILYGASEFALRMIEQCENENNMVQIIGITDKRISSKGEYYKDIPLLPVDDVIAQNRDDVCIVITAMGFCQEIIKELQGKGKIISLKELIEDV